MMVWALPSCFYVTSVDYRSRINVNSAAKLGPNLTQPWLKRLITEQICQVSPDPSQLS